MNLRMREPMTFQIPPKRLWGITWRIRFVVTGTGRSGTRYIAELLSAAGVPTGHECWFGPWPGLFRGPEPIHRRTPWERVQGPFARLRQELRRRRCAIAGDASWLAVPYLPKFRGHVYLQVRHPLTFVASFLGLGILQKADSPYAGFLTRHFHITGEPISDAVRFWMEWNLRALPYAHRVWHLEDLDVEIVAQVLSDLGVPHPHRRAEAAFRACPFPVNTARERLSTPRPISWQEIPVSLRDPLTRVARTLGYDPEVPDA